MKLRNSIPDEGMKRLAQSNESDLFRTEEDPALLAEFLYERLYKTAFDVLNTQIQRAPLKAATITELESFLGNMIPHLLEGLDLNEYVE